jgi:hypothetical protein
VENDKEELLEFLKHTADHNISDLLFLKEAYKISCIDSLDLNDSLNDAFRLGRKHERLFWKIVILEFLGED